MKSCRPAYKPLSLLQNRKTKYENRGTCPRFSCICAANAISCALPRGSVSIAKTDFIDRLKKGETAWFRPFSPIFTIYLTNCVLPISRDTNLTPKCLHSLQQFRCVLLLRTENVNVCVVCCRNIRMAKPLADYADRYARFQCPRSKGMSQLM